MRRSVTISVYRAHPKWNSGRVCLPSQILAVTNRRFGGITLPGGKVEEGEDVEVAAMRELYEETGIVPAGLKYLGCSPFNNPMYANSHSYLVSHFEAIINNPTPCQMEEGTIPIWVNPKHLLDPLCEPKSIFSYHYNKIIELGVIRC